MPMLQYKSPLSYGTPLLNIPGIKGYCRHKLSTTRRKNTYFLPLEKNSATSQKQNLLINYMPDFVLGLYQKNLTKIHTDQYNKHSR